MMWHEPRARPEPRQGNRALGSWMQNSVRARDRGSVWMRPCAPCRRSCSALNSSLCPASHWRSDDAWQRCPLPNQGTDAQRPVTCFRWAKPILFQAVYVRRFNKTCNKIKIECATGILTSRFENTTWDDEVRSAHRKKALRIKLDYIFLVDNLLLKIPNAAKWKDSFARSLSNWVDVVIFGLHENTSYYLTESSLFLKHLELECLFLSLVYVYLGGSLFLSGLTLPPLTPPLTGAQSFIWRALIGRRSSSIPGAPPIERTPLATNRWSPSSTDNYRLLFGEPFRGIGRRRAKILAFNQTA